MVKHLIKCRCVLPQFKKMQDPPQHEFVVFSKFDENDNVVPKFAQCTNCGAIHHVFEIQKSQILQGKEAMSSIVTIDDIKPSLPDNLKNILDSNKADLPTWEYAQYIIENELWGNFVVLSART